jgi:hypothetical protein
VPKIIDLAKDSDALAIEITDAAPEAVALLGDARNLEFYIIGKAGDFDEFAVPVISLLKTSGAACLWPKPRRSRVFGGGAGSSEAEPMFTSPEASSSHFREKAI